MLQTLIENAPERIKSTFIHRIHGKNSSILLPGEKNPYLYILTSGTADVLTQSLLGSAVTLYTYHAYSCFGELEIFSESARTFDIKAKTNCTTVAVHKDDLFLWMKEDFQFTRYLIEQLTEKLLKSSNTLTTLSLLNTKDRLLNNIYSHYLIGDLLQLTKQQVCDETCIPLRSLNRSIAQCKEEGFISFEKRGFI